MVMKPSFDDWWSEFKLKAVEMSALWICAFGKESFRCYFDDDATPEEAILDECSYCDD